VVVAAVLDPLLYHSVTINTRGESYRLKERLKAYMLGHFPPPAPTQSEN